MTYSLCQGHTNISVESTYTLVSVHTTQNFVCDECKNVGTHQILQCSSRGLKVSDFEPVLLRVKLFLLYNMLYQLFSHSF